MLIADAHIHRSMHLWKCNRLSTLTLLYWDLGPYRISRQPFVQGSNANLANTILTTRPTEHVIYNHYLHLSIRGSSEGRSGTI